MPIYRYKVLSESGMVITGESLSSSKDELISELLAHGYRVQYISDHGAWAMPWKRTSISQLQFSLFVNELLSLLKAGLPVAEALELTSDRHGEPTLEKIIINVLKAVRAGSTLSEAFSMHKDKLDELFVSVLKTGEKSGNLPAALEQYLIYLGSRIKLYKKLKQALAYPLFLLASLLVILGVMFFFVMPRFASMYDNFGAELPGPTQVLMTIASNIPLVIGITLVLFACTVIAFKTLNSNKSFKLRMESIRLSLPLIGKTYELISIAQVSRSLAILVSSGTPLVDSLRTIRESISSITYASRIQNVEASILSGNSLTDAVSQARLLPKTAVKLIRAGEASGNLGAMLSEVADYYHDMLDSRLERTMALIEPLFIMVMGLIVGAVIIIMYLPIFKLAEVV
jgi:type IV pilus assembly protein PilC